MTTAAVAAATTPGLGVGHIYKQVGLAGEVVNIFAECLENWVPVSSLEVLQAHGQAGSSPLSATAADEERVPAPIQQPGKKHRILENRPLSREAVRLRNERGRLRTAEEDRGEVTDFVVDRTSG